MKIKNALTLVYTVFVICIDLLCILSLIPLGEEESLCTCSYMCSVNRTGNEVYVNSTLLALDSEYIYP